MSNAVNDGTIDQVVAEARAAADIGAHTFWAPQIFGHDTMSVLSIVGREVPGIELGTAVAPTFPRHPMMMAQQALTVQQATGGHFVLGIGLSHQVVVEHMWGVSFDKPVRHMREYLEVLMPLLAGQGVQHQGEVFRVAGALSVSGIPRPTVLVAALGAQMLRVAGTLADGTSTWCVGPRTLADHIVPTLRQAAADAGRPAPRVVCALPVSVTDDVDASRRRAAAAFAIYDTLPSYKTMMNREGVAGPGDLAICGSEDEVRGQLEHLAVIGVTDFSAGVYATDPEERARTLAVLKAWGR